LKIKTIGDAFMAASGVPEHSSDHLERMAKFALDVLDSTQNLVDPLERQLRMRIGMHCGPLVAGVVGSRSQAYDLWGDTVNLASRMESHGQPGSVVVSPAVYARLRDDFEFEPRPEQMVKGQGIMITYVLVREIPRRRFSVLSVASTALGDVNEDRMWEGAPAGLNIPGTPSAHEDASSVATYGASIASLGGGDNAV